MDLDLGDCASEAAQTLISKKPKQNEVLFFFSFFNWSSLYLIGYFRRKKILGFAEFDGIWLFCVVGIWNWIGGFLLVFFVGLVKIVNFVWGVGGYLVTGVVDFGLGMICNCFVSFLLLICFGDSNNWHAFVVKRFYFGFWGSWGKVSKKVIVFGCWES